MKRLYKVIVLFTLIFTLSNVNAVCDDEKINDWAEKLDIKFEEITDESYPYSYLLMLNNPRTDLKVEAKDTYSNGTYIVDYDEDFKNYVIGSEIHFINKEYNLNIYMSDNASVCKGELVKTIKYVVPKYNTYNDTLYCENNPKDPSCGSYTDVDKNDDMNDKVNEYYDKQVEKEELSNKPLSQKMLYIFLEYAPYVLVPLIVLVIIYMIVIRVIKKRSEEK